MKNCRSCGAEITWETIDGKWHPYNLNGTSHFDTCPQANSWRKQSRKKTEDNKFVESQESLKEKQEKLDVHTT